MQNLILAIRGRLAAFTGAFAALMLGAFLMASSSSAATGDDPVSDAFTAMQDKVTTYGTAVVALVVLATGIFLGIKWLKKGVSKA